MTGGEEEQAMPQQERPRRWNRQGRQDFLKRAVLIGIGLAIVGAFPGNPIMAKAEKTLPSSGSLTLGGDIQPGTSIPIKAKCDMLQVNEIDFPVQRHGYVRVDVGFQFIDGKTTGGAQFKMQLLSKDNKVFSEQIEIEKRNRQLPVAYLGRGVKLGGDDEPNRVGRAELRFRNTKPSDVTQFSLEITPAQ